MQQTWLPSECISRPPAISPMPFDNIYNDKYAGYDTSSTVPLGTNLLHDPTQAQQQNNSLRFTSPQPPSVSQYSNQERLPFDNVYSNRYAGYDTSSSVPLGSSKYQGLSGSSEYQTSTQYGFGPSTNNFVSPSSCFSNAFAGAGTKSSLTVANFGGSETFPIREIATTHSTTYRNPMTGPRGDGLTLPLLQMGHSPSLAAKGDTSNIGGVAGSQNLKSPKVSESATSLQVEELIREVARLRVTNKELEDKVKYLEASACSCTKNNY